MNLYSTDSLGSLDSTQIKLHFRRSREAAISELNLFWAKAAMRRVLPRSLSCMLQSNNNCCATCLM